MPGVSVPLRTSPSQCVIDIRQDGMDTAGGDGRLILSNLYLRLKPSTEARNSALLLKAPERELYLLGMVFKGEGSACRALDVPDGGRVFAAGVLLSWRPFLYLHHATCSLLPLCVAE
jgi:hypothetical protein